MAAATKERGQAVPKQRDGEDAPAGGGRKKMIIIGAGALVLLVAVAGWFFLMGPGAGGGADAAEGEGAAEEHEEEHELGAVLALETTTINLAEGHYLQLGMALQFVLHEGGGGHGGVEPDGSQALDIAIRHYAGASMAELSDPDAFAHRKAELVELVSEAYHHEVVDVYFTSFVMQ